MSKNDLLLKRDKDFLHPVGRQAAVEGVEERVLQVLADFFEEGRGLAFAEEVHREDPETGATLVADTADARLRAEFARNQAGARANRDRFLRSLDIDAINVRTDQPYTIALLRFFRDRERRR